MISADTFRIEMHPDTVAAFRDVLAQLGVTGADAAVVFDMSKHAAAEALATLARVSMSAPPHLRIHVGALANHVVNVMTDTDGAGGAHVLTMTQEEFDKLQTK